MYGIAARGVLPDDADTGDHTSVIQVDQLIYAHLDRTDQIDEALHALERGVATPEDTSIGPARSLSIDGILGPEPFDHSRWAGLVPHLEGAPDDGGIRLRHRLLPQPGGFEGFGAVEEELFADDSPVGNRQEHGPVAVKPGSAALAGADDMPAHEDAGVPEVEQFSGRKLEVAPLGDPALLKADALRATAIYAVEAEADEPRIGYEFDIGVVGREGRLRSRLD